MRCKIGRQDELTLTKGNMDVVCFQPIFQHEARMELADLYGGFMDRKLFIQLMDEIVYTEDLEGSTPEHPIQDVRTMICNDYQNTRNPQMKFHWSKAQNPDDIEPGWHLCADEYWKEQENSFKAQKNAEIADPVEIMMQEFKIEI